MTLSGGNIVYYLYLLGRMKLIWCSLVFLIYH